MTGIGAISHANVFNPKHWTLLVQIVGLFGAVSEVSQKSARSTEFAGVRLEARLGLIVPVAEARKYILHEKWVVRKRSSGVIVRRLHVNCIGVEENVRKRYVSCFGGS